MADTLLAGDAPAPGTAAAGDVTDAGTTPVAEASAGADTSPQGEAGQADAAKADAKPAVPETYEFVAPEGVTLDASLVAEFTPIAKELGLTQEQAQKVVDLHTKAIAATETKIREAWESQQAGWLEAAKADPEIGGAKLTDTVAVAKKAMDRFATPQLREVLEQTGLGNHPELVRLMAKIGKAISEDTLVGVNAGEAPDRLRSMYPSMYK